MSVSLHTKHIVKQFCGHNVRRIAAPITVAVIGSDGSGKSAQIEIVAARETVQ